MSNKSELYAENMSIWHLSPYFYYSVLRVRSSCSGRSRNYYYYYCCFYYYYYAVLQKLVR